MNQDGDSVKLVSSGWDRSGVIDPLGRFAPGVPLFVADTVEDLPAGFVPSHRFGDPDGKHSLFCISEVNFGVWIGSLPDVFAIDDRLVGIAADRVATGLLKSRTGVGRFLP